MKYVRKDAEKAFERLMDRLGKKKAMAYNDVGGWELDYSKDYGGFRIEEISSKTGGVKSPLGGGRMSAKEFVQCVSFLIDALDSGLVMTLRGREF